MNILSIQSHVAYGHVGNSAAVFPLQRIGVEVWPIHTVQYSNHTGYDEWQGEAVHASLIKKLVAGIEQRNVLGECDGVLSGYMGSAEIGAAILEAVATVRKANPSAHYCCDPVIGDVGRGIFVAQGIPEFMKKKAVPAADIVTPNHFELDYLAGRESKTLAQVRDAVKAVHDLGPRVILVTSLHCEETPEDAVDLLASDGERCFRLRTPRLQVDGQWGGRRHRRAVLCAFPAQRPHRRGARQGGLQHFRRAEEDGRGRHARNPAHHRAGRIRRAERVVQGGRADGISETVRGASNHIDRCRACRCAAIRSNCRFACRFRPVRS